MLSVLIWAPKFNAGEKAVGSVGITGDSTHTHTFPVKNKLDRNIHLNRNISEGKKPSWLPVQRGEETVHTWELALETRR